MIDLHLHTTASDGALSPADLVARAASAGITLLAVTDHDTTAGLAEARAAANVRGLTFVDGIEITAVEDERDIHVLGYFFDPSDSRLQGFLDGQRADRARRLQEIAIRLAALGFPFDAQPLLEAARGRVRSIGRPHIAAALVAAGYARDKDDAFDRLLAEGRPAYVARCGASAAEVVAVIRAAGGIASLAHPGLHQRDDLIPGLARAGLAAIEARHSDHDPATEAHYRAIAAAHGLAVSGGSDFHDDAGPHVPSLGIVTLPAEDFAALQERLP